MFAGFFDFISVYLQYTNLYNFIWVTQNRYNYAGPELLASSFVVTQFVFAVVVFVIFILVLAFIVRAKLQRSI